MQPDPTDPQRPASRATGHARPDLVLAHGVDAPDPADPAEPITLRAATQDLWHRRIGRRSVMTRGALTAGDYLRDRASARLRHPRRGGP